MNFYNRTEAIQLINKLGIEEEPFLFVISYNEESSFVCRLNDIDSNEVLFSFPSFQNDKDIISHQSKEIEWNIHPESVEDYRKKFNIVQQHLHAGNSFLVNLTCRIPVTTNVSLQEIYLRSQAPYKLWFKSQLVCFSPETFINIHQGRISSFPMKGTIDATLPDAENLLMSDTKEAAEHATIVDLIRNDISMVAHHVHVPRYRYTDLLHTNKGDILQTSSEISGLLDNDYRDHLGDILFTQLPAGSITGAPKKKTTEIIQEAEDYERGFYTGVMGICHKGNLESAVMIRFIEQEKGLLYFKAGGGITANSNYLNEYNEIIQKSYVPIY